MKYSYGYGFGKTDKKKNEILELGKDYKIKYSLIEPNLKNGFEFNKDCYEAIIIEKNINIDNFKEDEFERDLEYLANLYQEYERKFEHAIIPEIGQKQLSLLDTNQMSYEEINDRLLQLIEEAGILAKALREIRKT